jgi:hypothetical protein
MSALAKPDLVPRVEVALAAHGGGVYTLLREFLSGPGREQFVISHAGRAQLLIADYDNEPSRDDLHRFLLRAQGPAIVLAVTDPGIPGSIWVPKPVQETTLLAASQHMAQRLARSPSPATRPALRLLPLEVPAPAVPEQPWHTTRPSGRRLNGPFSAAQREDWTGRILFMAMGALGIAAAVSSMGWRPAEQSFRPPASRTEVAPAASEPAQNLRQAIAAARQSIPPLTAAQRASVEAEITEYWQLAAALQGESRSMAQLSLTVELPSVSRRALPVALMAEAPAPWRGQMVLRDALRAAVQGAPAPATAQIPTPAPALALRAP